MGTFTTKLRIWNPAMPGQVEELEVWVDTGARYSWISRDRLEKLGIRPGRKVQFQTIEGRVIEREMAPAFVSTDGYVGGDTVVMAEPGDMEVMGAYTLESLGLTVDVVHQKLVPVVVHLALAATGSTVKVRRSRIVMAIDDDIEDGRLGEPFSE